jgi:hypothetical protein
MVERRAEQKQCLRLSVDNTFISRRSEARQERPRPYSTRHSTRRGHERGNGLRLSEFGTELPIRDVRCHGEYWG